tara:strand:+ start:96 stop:356 length:261 start_codon:yes stop_codon:yes gene_type:complete
MEEKKYDNKNSGSFWPNDRKELDWHADYNGKVDVEGTMFWADLSKVDSDNPKSPKFKIKFRPVTVGTEKPKPAAAFNDSIEDEIPF